MTRRISAKRRLRAESLESRQLLHGGGVGGASVSIEDRVAGVFERYDANEDMELAEDELSEGLWERVSAADGDDENVTVSADELTAHLEARAAERAENMEERRGRRRDRREDRQVRRGERTTIEERIESFFAENDTDGDGVITSADEVSEELLERIAEADIDDNGVSADELLAHHEARQAERQQARFDRAFARLDDDGDGNVTAEEAGERRWERISEADTDGDGNVTAEELQTYLEAERAEREAEREAEEEADEEAGEEVEPEVQVAAVEGNGQRQAARRLRARR